MEKLSKIIFSSIAALFACGEYPTEDSSGLESRLDPDSPPSWKEFKSAAMRPGPAGEASYVVEWDVPILTESELMAYYSANVLGEAEKGLVRLHLGQDDVWLNGDQLHLRYCVDTAFDEPPVGEATFARVVEAMHEATSAWEAVANVSFVYDPSNNDSCGAIGDPAPDSRYVKVSREYLECAFYPQSRATCGLDGSTLALRGNYDEDNEFHTLSGVLKHELGHILGLEHEHVHPSGGGCSSVIPARTLSPNADPSSIMAYPSSSESCSLLESSRAELSRGDGLAARALYGAPAVWFVVYG